MVASFQTQATLASAKRKRSFLYMFLLFIFLFIVLIINNTVAKWSNCWSKVDIEFGCTTLLDKEDDADSLIDRADKSMYKDKKEMKQEI